MKKLMKRLTVCFLIAALVWCGALICDRQKLRRELIRLHVVANSDSAEDQRLKLRVRDAVVQSLQQELKQVENPETAKAYLRRKLPALQQLAEDTLHALGCDAEVTVSLCEEIFETRQWENFRFPAGVYETLRLTIGSGSGENWWGIVFPGFFGEEAAAETGATFSPGLKKTLEGTYTIRFACLEALGKLENIFFAG